MLGRPNPLPGSASLRSDAGASPRTPDPEDRQHERRRGRQECLRHGRARPPAFAIACFFVLMPGTMFRVAAQDPKPTEYQVKAAYLSNFGRFVDAWGSAAKPSVEEAFSICVLGKDPFGSSLDIAVKGESIAGVTVAVKRISQPPEVQGCRVLFISSSEQGQLSAILSALANAPVLTVADIPDFVKRGGMIQFVLDGNRVRFEIDMAAAGRAGLTLSSDLLKVARVVRRTP